MDIGTVVVKGACTAPNTGPNNIQAFCNVYFDENPYSLVDEQGQFVNLMHIAGSPGAPNSRNS